MLVFEMRVCVCVCVCVFAMDLFLRMKSYLEV